MNKKLYLDIILYRKVIEYILKGRIKQMNDRELLEFIAAQVGNLTQQVGNLTQEVGNINQKIETINADITDLKKGQDITNKTLVRLENDNNAKFTALFDGYRQNAEKLERIEKEVTKQEEIIMRRVK